MIISGPTMSGKSHFMFLVLNQCTYHHRQGVKRRLKEIELIWKTPRKSGWTQRVTKHFSISSCFTNWHKLADGFQSSLKKRPEQDPGSSEFQQDLIRRSKP
jgi:hypothetical protein